jgi:phosphate starvation-inducible membrane PsiE
MAPSSSSALPIYLSCEMYSPVIKTIFTEIQSESYILTDDLNLVFFFFFFIAFPKKYWRIHFTRQIYRKSTWWWRRHVEFKTIF